MVVIWLFSASKLRDALRWLCLKLVAADRAIFISLFIFRLMLSMFILPFDRFGMYISVFILFDVEFRCAYIEYYNRTFLACKRFPCYHRKNNIRGIQYVSEYR